MKRVAAVLVLALALVACGPTEGAVVDKRVVRSDSQLYIRGHGWISVDKDTYGKCAIGVYYPTCKN